MLLNSVMLKRILQSVLLSIIVVMGLFYTFENEIYDYLDNEIYAFKKLDMERRSLQAKEKVCGWIINPTEKELLECVDTRLKLVQINKQIHNDFKILFFALSMKYYYKSISKVVDID